MAQHQMPTEKTAFIPKALHSLRSHPVTCSFKVGRADDISYNHTYTIRWEEDKNYTKTTSASSQAVISALEAAATCPKSSFSTQTGQTNSAPLETRCSGPCGRMYPVRKLRTMGRCDHLLCRICYGLVVNRDGSLGCSAFSCVYNNFYEFLPIENAKEHYKKEIFNRMIEKEGRLKKGIINGEDVPLRSNASARSEVSEGGIWSASTVTSPVSSKRSSRCPSNVPPNAQLDTGSVNVSVENLSNDSKDLPAARAGSELLMCNTVESFNGSTIASQSYSSTPQRPVAPVKKIDPLVTLFPSSLLFVRVLIYVSVDGSRAVKRIYTCGELPSIAPVASVVVALAERRSGARALSDSVYYVFYPGNKQEPLKKIADERRPLSDFAQEGTVHLIADSAEYLRNYA